MAVARLYHFLGLPVFSGTGPLYIGSRRLHGDLIGAFAMRLLAYYIVFVLVGTGVAYLIGRAVEQWSAGVKVPVFLACFFFVFWGLLGGGGASDLAPLAGSFSP